MTAPLYSPVELDQMMAQAAEMGWTFPEWLENFERLCGDHGAILITRPSSRPVTLGRLAIDHRIILLGILEILDELLENPTAAEHLRDQIEKRAQLAIALAAEKPPRAED